jgi:hypothetical protein
VAANRIDIVVGQADGLVAQQEATTLDWQEVSRVVPFDRSSKLDRSLTAGAT